jgi:hypothetical protein
MGTPPRTKSAWLLAFSYVKYLANAPTACLKNKTLYVLCRQSQNRCELGDGKPRGPRYTMDQLQSRGVTSAGLPLWIIRAEETTKGQAFLSGGRCDARYQTKNFLKE